MWRIVSRLMTCLVAWAVLAADPAAAEKRVALVVGNAAYEAAGRLRNPANDAKDISAALERLDFDVTTVVDAKGGPFATALANFADAIVDADVALFWYAGHGIQYQSANYLLPIDAKLENAFAVKRETFAVSDVIRRMETSAKISLVFLDACRNTPLTDRLKASLGTSSRAASVGRGLARVENEAPNTLIVFATAPGEIAEDGTGRNSPFAKAMLEHIETPGVDVEVMLKDVTSDVRKATDGRQRPERLSRLESKFMFAPKADETSGGDLVAAADRRREEAAQAEERKLGAARDAAEADRRRAEAETALQEAEKRKQAADSEARRRKDAELDRRLAIAEREAREAEERKRAAEAAAAEAEARQRKAEAEARIAELRARQAEAAAGQGGESRTAGLYEDRNTAEDGAWPPRRNEGGQARTAAATALWEHNGSTMSLVVEGEHGRRFRYLRPRRNIYEQGARRGTVLFEGAVDENREWVGTAYVFSRRCGMQAYEVRGKAEAGGRRVTLRGRAPRVDADCRVVDHREDVLVFDKVQG